MMELQHFLMDTFQFKSNLLQQLLLPLPTMSTPLPPCNNFIHTSLDKTTSMLVEEFKTVTTASIENGIRDSFDPSNQRDLELIQIFRNHGKTFNKLLDTIEKELRFHPKASSSSTASITPTPPNSPVESSGHSHSITINE